MFLARPSRTLAPLALALAAVAILIAIVPPGTLPALACVAGNILLLVTAFALVVVGGVVALFVRSREALAGLALAVVPFALGALAVRMGAPACFD